MKYVVRTLGELGEELVLAPERWLAAVGGLADESDAIALGTLVMERSERSTAVDAVVIDTTHARDGVLDVPAAMRASASAKSSKKVAYAGDLIVSRLRPYLRQIAFIHPKALEMTGGRPLALSSEFYVLASRSRGDSPRATSASLAFLLPFFLGDATQTKLADAQEGGHHPRVPRTSLLALRVPAALVHARKNGSKEVLAALNALYLATERYEAIVSSDANA